MDVNKHYEIIKFGYEYKMLVNLGYTSNIIPPKPIDEPYYSLDENGIITAKQGYCWDGATGGIDTPNFMRGSLFHDICCQMINEGRLPRSYRKKCDKLLYKILREDGMNIIRAKWVVYNSVRAYAKLAGYE